MYERVIFLKHEQFRRQLSADLTIFLSYVKMRRKNDSNWLSLSEYQGKGEGKELYSS